MSACSLDLVNTSDASCSSPRPQPGQRPWHPERSCRPSGPPGVTMAVWPTRSATSTAANMFGGVIGAVTAGFVIVPTIGVRGGLLAAAVAYIVLADLLAAPQSRLRPLAYAALLLIVVADPLRAPLVHLRSARRDPAHPQSKGHTGIVTVVEAGDDLQLRLDNYYVLGSSAAATNERRQGLLPLLLHPDPHRVAFIGLATGITASAGPALGVQETTVY